MTNIKAYNLGQIKEADIELGDFTVFVGPQASGKSILLQMMKLAEDRSGIKSLMIKHGFQWNNDIGEFLELYLGEGMSSVFNNNTKLFLSDEEFEFNKINYVEVEQKEKLFYIPAQRVLSIPNGWPKPFESYEMRDPYVLKRFSEHLRKMLDFLGSRNIELLTALDNIKKPFQDKIYEEIFVNAKIELDKESPRNRIMLKFQNNLFPYMAWSSGQKEFGPLLLGIYYLESILMFKKSPDGDYVVIEEPEMGLHPKAIQALLAFLLYLVTKGYKVIVSTHSPVILELSWAVRTMQELKASPDNLQTLFEMNKHNDKELNEIFANILQHKNFKSYYFNRKPEGVFTQDISSLDPGTDDDNIADWGGLTSFGTRASEIISNLVAKNGI